MSFIIFFSTFGLSKEVKMFTKACEYGIRAVIWIAKKSLNGEIVNIKEVAEAIASPEAYTSKILQKLTKKQVVQSKKGPTGGFFITQQFLNDGKLIHIVEAIDGNDLFKNCALGLKKCNALEPCSIHHRYVAIRKDLKAMLETTSIQTLALEFKEGDAFLKRIES